MSSTPDEAEQPDVYDLDYQDDWGAPFQPDGLLDEEGEDDSLLDSEMKALGWPPYDTE